MRNFAGGHARNQYGIDPELNHAWDNRHESPDAICRCQRCVRHAVGKLRNEAKLESERIRSWRDGGQSPPHHFDYARSKHGRTPYRGKATEPYPQ
jgi:hypothetical protein